MYCASTTPPPVASAGNSHRNTAFTESMSDTPETAASLQLATITVSAMPMVMASACSTISGTSSFRRSARLNILSNLLSPFPLQKSRAPIVPRQQHNCKCRFQQGAG